MSPDCPKLGNYRLVQPKLLNLTQSGHIGDPGSKWLIFKNIWGFRTKVNPDYQTITLSFLLRFVRLG